MATLPTSISEYSRLGRSGGATATLSQLLASTVALFSFAGGAIHFAVIRHHLESVPLTAAFALMGGAQWWFAARALAMSSLTRSAGLVLHAAILSTWLLSRTVGLALVPGAEQPAPIGTADLVANLFAAVVVVTLVLLKELDRRPSPALVREGSARAIWLVIAAAVLLAGVPAVLAPHDHHEGPRATGPEASHRDQGPTAPDGHHHE